MNKVLHRRMRGAKYLRVVPRVVAAAQDLLAFDRMMPSRVANMTAGACKQLSGVPELFGLPIRRCANPTFPLPARQVPCVGRRPALSCAPG